MEDNIHHSSPDRNREYESMNERPESSRRLAFKIGYRRKLFLEDRLVCTPGHHQYVCMFGCPTLQPWCTTVAMMTHIVSLFASASSQPYARSVLERHYTQYWISFGRKSVIYIIMTNTHRFDISCRPTRECDACWQGRIFAIPSRIVSISKSSSNRKEVYFDDDVRR